MLVGSHGAPNHGTGCDDRSGRDRSPGGFADECLSDDTRGDHADHECCDDPVRVWHAIDQFDPPGQSRRDDARGSRCDDDGGNGHGQSVRVDTCGNARGRHSHGYVDDNAHRDRDPLGAVSPSSSRAADDRRSSD